ncbi:MAG: hypothetical protein ACH37Z_04185 [Anaerolineae bacterium]
MKNKYTCANDYCDLGLTERPRYFPRQVVTATDMTLDQNYARDRMRRHNRMLHGWGIVCGAQLCCIQDSELQKGTSKIRIKCGYILGPFGDEIILDHDVVLDLLVGSLVAHCGDPLGELPDPYCNPPKAITSTKDAVERWVAIRYQEIKSRPVRVQPAGCGCDENPCEASRWCDGYEIRALTEDPYKDAEPPEIEAYEGERTPSGGIPECPPCPDSPWVVLGKVVMAGGIITKVTHEGRRHVLSFGNFWWRSADRQIEGCPEALANGDAAAPTD